MRATWEDLEKSGKCTAKKKRDGGGTVAWLIS
jgi:hypothetical protein